MITLEGLQAKKNTGSTTTKKGITLEGLQARRNISQPLPYTDTTGKLNPIALTQGVQNIAQTANQEQQKKSTFDMPRQPVNTSAGDTTFIPQSTINDYALQDVVKKENKVADKYDSGKFVSNYTMGDIQTDLNQAYSEYSKYPTEANRLKVERLGQLEQDYMQNAQNVGKGGLITKELATHLPQQVEQIGQGVKGAVVGGIGGTIIGGPAAGLAGAKGGYVAGVTQYSYDQMQGGAYRDLISMGVPADIALNVSKDSALWQSLIEGAGAVGDLATLGVGKLLTTPAKTATQATAKQMLKEALKAYGYNVVSEFAEEAGQEYVGVKGEKVAMAQAGLEREATTQDDIRRVLEAGKSGATIGAIMGAGNLAGNVGTTLADNVQIRNAQQNIAPQSPQTEQTQPTNEVIPQEVQNRNTANMVQNKVNVPNNVQNQSNIEQISQNNVENAQNLQKTTQNDTERDFLENYETDTQRHITSNKDNIIVKNYKQLDNLVDEALNTNNNKELHLGRINQTLTQKIKNKILNLPKNKTEMLNRDKYDLVLHQSEIRHLKDGKVKLTDEEVHDYVKKLPEIITNPDTISYSKNNKDEGLRFKKQFGDGTYISFTLVANSKYTLTVKSIYMDKTDYETKKRSVSPPNDVLTTSDKTSKTSGALASTNIIQPTEDFVNLPTAEQLNQPSQEMIEAAQAMTLEEPQRMNLKKPKLEEIAELTAENAQLPKGSYKQNADKMTAYRRKFWDNVESSNIIGQNIKDKVNMTNYERKTNDDTLNKMKERLDTDPVRLTQEWWAKDIKKATDQDIALGAILLERYQQEGRFDEAVDVVQKLADIGTEAGRTVQMYSIFQRLTPEGMQIYQQRKLNSALENITKKQTGKWVEQNKDKFKLTEDDRTFITAKVQEAQNAPTERQKQIALAEIEKRINDKLPPEAGQSVKAFRRIAMLFNPKTQVRNVVGNTTVMPLNYVTDLVAAGIDKAIAKKTGIRTTTLPSAKTVLKGAKKGLAETWDDYRKGIRTTPTGTKYEIQNNVKSFNENTGNKAADWVNNKLNGIDRILSSVMEAGDRPFYEAAYQNSLQGQMKANGVTEPTQDMIDIASNVALSQTWQDSNNYTQAVLGIRSAFNKINIHGFGLGDLIIPFAKTPANLTKAMVEYSPAGLIPTIINYNDMRKAISRGDMTPMQQKKFVTSVGKAAAGTLLYVLANSLVQSGAITGSSDKDKDVANFEKNVLGIQPYSIRIGDKTYTYNWAQPLAAPLAIMADAHKMSEEGAELNDILLNALKVGGDQLVANSFLQGIQELLSSQYSNESMMDNLVGAIMDLPTQFTPTLLGQIATYTDATKRQTYENGDAVGTMVNEVKNKIPGKKETLAPQVNTFGEEILNYGGDNSAFNVFFNPGNISSANATDTQKELYALYEATQDTTIFPRQAPYSVSGGGEKVPLSSKDRAEYQKASGQYVTKELDALFDSNFYKSLENEQKAEIVNKIVSDADTTAKSKWVETTTTAQLADKQEKLEKASIPLVDYYNAWAAQKDIEGIPGPDGKTLSGSKSRLKKEAIDKATADLNKYQRRVLYEMFNIGESVW